MEQIQNIADTGLIIFLGMMSWVGIFLVVAFGLQGIKNFLRDRKRRKKAGKQDCWRVD